MTVGSYLGSNLDVLGTMGSWAKWLGGSEVFASFFHGLPQASTTI